MGAEGAAPGQGRDAAPEVHVVFGVGQLGYAVAAEALARGADVIAASRVGSPGPPGARAVRCDATHPREVADVCRGASVVYGCAHPPYDRWAELFPPIQRGLIEGAARAGAVLAVAENLYMYGPVDAPLTEDLPYAARTRKGVVRASLATELREAHEAGRVRSTSGRASSFFGPRVTSSFMGPRVLGRAFRGSTVRVVGDPDAPHTYTYVEDFARALVTLATDERSLGRAWHVPSEPTVSTREFLELAGRVAGTRPKVRGVPRTVIRAGALAVPLLREVQEMLYAFERPFVVDHSRFAAAFGDHATPRAAALEATRAALTGQSPPAR